jgi:hypothetical protein
VELFSFNWMLIAALCFAPCRLQSRLEGVKELVITTQRDVAMKRAAAIREVQSAARALLKSLKLERKARQKGNTTSKIGRQLDLAMGDDILSNTQNNMSVTSAAASLDAAMESFRALERSSAGGDGAYAFDALLQQRRQQQQQQWQQQEEWVQDWARLLEKARSALRESLASGGSSSIGAAGSSLEEGYEAEVEAELQVRGCYTSIRCVMIMCVETGRIPLASCAGSLCGLRRRDGLSCTKWCP